MLLADTLSAILAKLAGAEVGSSTPPTVGDVELNQGASGVLVVPVVSAQGVRITQPAAGGAFASSGPVASRLIRTSQVFPSRLFFANGSGTPVIGQAFNANAAVAPGAVPVDAVVVPAGGTAEIRYPGPTTRFDVGGLMAFSSTLLTFTATAAVGLLGWDEYPDFL